MTAISGHHSELVKREHAATKAKLTAYRAQELLFNNLQSGDLSQICSRATNKARNEKENKVAAAKGVRDEKLSAIKKKYEEAADAKTVDVRQMIREKEGEVSHALKKKVKAAASVVSAKGDKIKTENDYEKRESELMFIKEERDKLVVGEKNEFDEASRAAEEAFKKTKAMLEGNFSEDVMRINKLGREKARKEKEKVRCWLAANYKSLKDKIKKNNYSIVMSRNFGVVNLPPEVDILECPDTPPQEAQVDILGPSPLILPAPSRASYSPVPSASADPVAVSAAVASDPPAPSAASAPSRTLTSAARRTCGGKEPRRTTGGKTPAHVASLVEKSSSLVNAGAGPESSSSSEEDEEDNEEDNASESALPPRKRRRCRSAFAKNAENG